MKKKKTQFLFGFTIAPRAGMARLFDMSIRVCENSTAASRAEGKIIAVLPISTLISLACRVFNKTDLV
jgi:hypothetical protein